MFLKIIRIRPRPGAEQQLRQGVERLLVPMAQASPGLIHVYPGSRIDEFTDEIVFAGVWKDEATARSFCAGGAPDEQRFLVDCWSSEIYEVFGIHGSARLSIDG